MVHHYVGFNAARGICSRFMKYNELSLSLYKFGNERFKARIFCMAYQCFEHALS